MNQFKHYLRLMRPAQWVKNTFIFLPAFFALQIDDPGVLLHLFQVFVGFSLVCSAVYVFNDLLDVKEDRQHPKKKFRPLASGAVNRQQALILIGLLLAVASVMLVLTATNVWVLAIVGFYLVMNISYTVKLKHISILDVVIIAVGFVLRVFIGGLVSDTHLSHWIILMTFVLALFLAFSKRRDDVFNYVRTGISARKNLEGYNLDFLNVVITCLATVVIVCYVMYCTSPEVIGRFGTNVYLTSIFVIMGVLRYLQLTLVWLISGNPTTILLENRFLQVIIVGWILSFVGIIYYNIHW